MANDEHEGAKELYYRSVKRAQQIAKGTVYIEEPVVEYLATLIVAEAYRRGIGAKVVESMEFCKYLSGLPSESLGLSVIKAETNGVN